MIALGTSSWSFEAWRGVFYPESVGKAEMLPYYARHFPTVEVNTSFYGLPEPSTLIKWVESVPEGFTFALKFPRVISHEKRLVDCKAETHAFMDALLALGSCAGPAFLQLPPDFSRQRYGRVLAEYVEWLATVREGLPVAVEVRAKDLMTEAFATFLAERNIALVLTDRKGTPDLYDVWAEVGKATQLAMIRWIGDDRNGPTGDREITAPQAERLDLWAERLIALEDRGMKVFGYMHNPYEGHSPASVRRLLARLGDRAMKWHPASDPLSPAGVDEDSGKDEDENTSAQMRLL